MTNNTINIPLCDLALQYNLLKDQIDQAVTGVMASGNYILGNNVALLEKEIAAYLGVDYAVGVASGTDALILALRAYGIGPGDRVIVPAFTMFATVEAVMQAGAMPVFVDVDKDTYCMDIAKIEQCITPDTRAIIPVHLFGRPAPMQSILDIAKEHNLVVIEDNAQGFGAKYFGSYTGAIGHAAALSFFPTKNLGCYGDGGMVLCKDTQIADKVRMLRTHGWKTKYYPELLGYNSRLDELQAAILRVKLPYVDAWNTRRREIADYYEVLLREVIQPSPYIYPAVEHVYHLYVVKLDSKEQREKVMDAMHIAKCACGVYYPIPAHMVQVCWALRALVGYNKDSFPVAKELCDTLLALPMYPELTMDQVEIIAGVVIRALT